jgi:hypothetical protein
MAGREAFFVCFGSNPNSGLSRLLEGPPLLQVLHIV